MTETSFRVPDPIIEDLKFIKKETGASQNSTVSTAIRLHLESFADKGMPVGSKRHLRQKDQSSEG